MRRAQKFRTRKWWRLDPATGEWEIVYMETDYIARTGQQFIASIGVHEPQEGDVLTYEYEDGP